MLNPTPDRLLLDGSGRPYFLWDCDLTDRQFRALLRDEDRRVRGAALGRLMRQAKPDDVFRYVTEPDVRSLWDEVQPYLGRSGRFWTWLLDTWADHHAR